EQDIGRFDVAVHDEPGMGMAQGIGHRSSYRDGFGPAGSTRPQPLVERRSLEVIRNDVKLSLLEPDVVHHHDARVTQLSQPSRLLQRLFILALPSLRLAPQHFNGHGPVELRIVSEINRTEASRPEWPLHLIA